MDNLLFKIEELQRINQYLETELSILESTIESLLSYVKDIQK